MKKTLALSAAIAVPAVPSVFFFFRTVDAAREIDSLKAQIRIQERNLTFFKGMSNQSFMLCPLTTGQLETAARENGYAVAHGANSMRVGSFEFETGSGDCIAKVRQLAS